MLRQSDILTFILPGWVVRYAEQNQQLCCISDAYDVKDSVSQYTAANRSRREEACLSSVAIFSEAQTRARQIDPQLRAADWKLSDRTQVRLEVPVDGSAADLKW